MPPTGGGGTGVHGSRQADAASSNSSMYEYAVKRPSRIIRFITAGDAHMASQVSSGWSLTDDRAHS